jgi:hypothetical protein
MRTGYFIKFSVTTPFSAMSSTIDTIDQNFSGRTDPEWIALVREKVESLRYGVVQLVVHDGRVTQIERTEKTRLPSSKSVAAE